ncbi:unnamed protein product [Adineta steineri]|uniref:NHL repeat containing protein-like protein n=1 Tax=Adineta steineri TaxID=433720 RepID=A0A813SHL6_9BILA|nr:unnamed protein product [Adineta steineri]CAF0797000.1 unnamed protein product [Adineta steineri]
MFFRLFLFLVLSFNQPKFSSTPIWDSNGITFADQSIVGQHPNAVFVSTNNTIYVANWQDDTILIWQEESVNPTKIIRGSFIGPYSLFVTSSGNVYIDDGLKNSRVQKWIAETNNFVTVMNVSTSCWGLFVDINDTLYCSMSNHHQVVKRPLNDAVMTSNVVAAGTGIQGSDSNQLDVPIGIFVDVNLDLYVADYENHRVQLFQPGESNGITVAGNGSLNPTITLRYPSGVILDAEKYLFIVEYGNSRIVGSGLNGFRCLVGCYAVSSQSSDLTTPFSFSFDHSGNMFVTDRGDSRIQKFFLMKDSFALSFNQPKFCSTATWDFKGITIANQSIIGQHPNAVFVSTNNTIYVANQENNTIVIWDEDSVDPTKIISGNFTKPYSLFVTLNGDIYIDDGDNNGRVQKWIAETNNFVTVMNVKSSCYGLFVDINNTLYCSMYNHHQVVKRSLNGLVMALNRVAAGTGRYGSASNELNFPHGIFVDVNLDLYVVDYGNRRVQLFQPGESNGNTVAELPSRDLTIVSPIPIGILLDAEKYFFIVDQYNSRIFGSRLNGFRCLVGCYERGSQSNQLNSPSSLSFDRSGNIFVTDTDNHRIQKFQYIEESCANTSSVVQTVYASELTTNSPTYLHTCFVLSTYYEAIQVNVRGSGLYTFFSKSSMVTYGSIYKEHFNPSNPFQNRLLYKYYSCILHQFRFTIALQSSIKYILVVSTVISKQKGEFSIFVSGPDNVDLKNISSPSVTEIKYSLAVQSKYSLQLTANSQTYSRDCRKSNYYYQTIRVNVVETGYYALSSNSSMDTFGDIYKDDFNPMNPFENLLSQDYWRCIWDDFSLIANLHSGTTYILVVTTSSPNVTGKFSIEISGPNHTVFDPYSKYFVLFVNH